MQTTVPPERNIVERLRGQPGRGTFEAHVTIEADDLNERQRFQSVCAALGVKCVLIELPRGVTRSQPMTSTYHRGELAAVTEEVAGLACRLRDEGFRVSRVKLEAVITNEGVPGTDEEARSFPPGNYFEFHIKLLLPPDIDLAPLQTVCQQHGAHLSTNALKRHDEGQSERFVTLRVHGVGRDRAETRFAALCEDLEGLGHTLANRLREYTIYDSNIAVDAGWIDPPAGAGSPGGGS